MWGCPTAWGYRWPVWFFQAVSQGSVPGCGWSHGVLPWLWEWGPFPDLSLDVSSPGHDLGCPFRWGRGALTRSRISSSVYFGALAQLGTPKGRLFWSLLVACSCS